MYIKRCLSLADRFIRTFMRCPEKYTTPISHQTRCYCVRDTKKSPKMWKSKLERRVPSRYDTHKQKLQNDVPVSSGVTLCVLSTGSKGLGRSLLLKTSLDRYLFNCGEGTFKLFSYSGKVGIVYNTFITYNCWDNIGGMLGCMMGYTDSHTPVQKFLIHGPKNVDVALDMTNMFSESNAGARALFEWRGIDHKQYKDNQLVVDYVELLSNKSVRMSPPSSPECGGSIPATSKTKSIVNINEKTVMAYIIKLKDLPPRVDPEKLRKLGIKPGRWVKNVIKMETVTMEDGRVVKPEDILMDSKDQIGPVIILDCPTLDYLDSLISNEQLLNFESKYNMPPHMIVHMAPCEIVNHPQYKEFMDRFQSDTVHLMLNENHEGPYLAKSQEFQVALNHIHPKLFPELNTIVDKKPEPQTESVIQGVHGLRYHLRPSNYRGFMWEDVSYFDRSTVWDNVKKKACEHAVDIISLLHDKEAIEHYESFDISTVDDELAKLRLKLADIESEKDLSEEYPELTFLGTGSAAPSSTRNASCILVQMRKDEYLLLDCGEGTLIQMYQMFGKEKTEHILSKIKGVFISHLHYDHHGGLYTIAEARERVINREGRKDKLLVLAPLSMKKWVMVYSRHILCRTASVDLVCIQTENFSNIVQQKLDLIECSAMQVRHTASSFGLAIKHRDGWKLAYSGDCMPSKNLVQEGKDCDILIHEGTFDDSQLEHAKMKKHSTTSQALDVAKEMNAKFTILTHFSQRFHTIPIFTSKFTDNVGFSFDFMQVRPSQLKLIPLLKPVLDCLYGAQVRRRLLVQKTGEKFTGNTSQAGKSAVDSQQVKAMIQNLSRNEQDLNKELGKSSEELTDSADAISNSSADNEMEADHYDKVEVGLKRKASWQKSDSKQLRTVDVEQSIK